MKKNWCMNSITVEISDKQEHHPLDVFESLLGEDWLRRDAQVLMSIRVFAAGIIGIFRPATEVPFELNEGFEFIYTTYDNPVSKTYSTWLEEIHNGQESIVHCMMLHRELKHRNLRWGDLTDNQKGLFRRLVILKKEDWGMEDLETGDDSGEAFDKFFNGDFIKPINTVLRPHGSVRAFKPTDILKEINGEHGGLIKGLENAHDYHVHEFNTESTDFACFCVRDEATLKEYLFETIDQPPIAPFVEFCKQYPDAKITVVSLIKHTNTCIRYALKGDTKLVHIGEIVVIPDEVVEISNATDFGTDAIYEESVVFRCPKWLMATGLVKAF